MSEEKFGQFVGDLVRDLDPAPEIPRDEIWAEVSSVHRFRRPAHCPSRTGIAWGLSLAATLAMGVGIGRMSLGDAAAGPVKSPATAQAETRMEDAPTTPRLYQVAAADYLQNTQVLLASLQGEARGGRTPEAAAWAKQLLLDTRLLIDSPAGRDPVMSRLLGDLELVLAQIATLPAHDPQEEIRLIEDGIQHNRVLARLRLAAGANGDD